MRKLKMLLYAGAMAGALGGTALAIEFPQSDGSTPTGPLQDAAGVGMLTNTSGFQEVGSPYTMGQGQQYTPLGSGAGSSPFSTPSPGTAIMRVDLQAVTAVQLAWWTGQNGQGLPLNTPAGGNKQQPYGVVGYFRLDVAVDGMSKTGIRYGAFSEVRENTVGGQSTFTAGSSSVPSGTIINTSAAGGTSADNSQNTLYIRNLCGYVGTDTVGIVRIGQGSCVDAGSLLLTGLNDEIGWGGWDGGEDLPPSNVQPAWPWPDAGADYMPAGVAYLSPVIFGFDVVTSFSPNNSTLSQGSACSSQFLGCNGATTSNASADLSRFVNRYEIGVRYRNAFGPVGLAVSGTYVVSGSVQPGPYLQSTAPTGTRYNGLNFGIIGAEVSINRYFAIGANTMFGAFNGAGALQPKPISGDTETTMAIAWEAGAKWTIPQVPITVGGSYYNFKYQGQPGLPTQRTSQGLDLEANYGLGPGMVVFASYMWGQVYQGDYNFLAAANGPANNKVQINMFTSGLALKF
jgi:hypothetical protein